MLELKVKLRVFSHDFFSSLSCLFKSFERGMNSLELELFLPDKSEMQWDKCQYFNHMT